MADFEEKLRKAFDAEAKQSPAPPNLRYRVVSKAVATPRRASWAAWLSRPRLATVGAVAAVLLISGIGFRVATQSRPIVGQPSPTASPITQLAFGPLPAASLHPPVGLGGGGGASTVEPYFGPATMTWAGTLPEVPASAPVDRFAIPTISDADAFAARLGGRVVSAGSATEAREYQLPGDYKLLIDMSNPVAGEPTFIINRQTPGGNQQQPLTEAAARAAADAELTRLNLAPSWKSAVTVFPFSGIGQAAPVYVVQYQRLIDVTTTLTAGEVDGNADPSGLQVMVEPSGKVGRISGAIRLSLQPAMYPLRPPSTTVNDALHQQPLVDPTAAPQTVTLTKATLVYRVVSAGTVGYLEPAYLFTGRFTTHGATLEKRVLIPALAPRALSPPTRIPSPRPATAAEYAGMVAVGKAAAEQQLRIPDCGSSSPGPSHDCFVAQPASNAIVDSQAGYFEGGRLGAGCWVYLYEDATGWDFVDVVCAQALGMLPRIGQDDRVQVTGCANVRGQPSLQAQVLACLPSGTTVHITGGPVYADGRIWWYLQDRGWMVHDSLIP